MLTTKCGDRGDDRQRLIEREVVREAEDVKALRSKIFVSPSVIGSAMVVAAAVKLDDQPPRRDVEIRDIAGEDMLAPGANAEPGAAEMTPQSDLGERLIGTELFGEGLQLGIRSRKGCVVQFSNPQPAVYPHPRDRGGFRHLRAL